jgi:LysM repeat protein
MRSVLMISAALSLTLAGAASAQTAELDDDRFKPRVYGNLGVVAPVYQQGTVEIYQPETTSQTATQITGGTITRVVEPVAPTITTQIQAPVTYTTGEVVKAQHYKQGDLSDAEYQALLDEADRVRAYQGISNREAQAVGVSETYEGAYEVDLYAPAAETTPASAISAIPSGMATVTTTTLHEVVKGDTLYNVSKRFGTTVAALQDENGLSGTNISLGQTLRIPGNSIPVQSLNTTMAQPIFASAPVQQGYITRRVVQPVSVSTTPANYAVLPKDTLYGISRRTCVSPADLISANSLSNPNQLKPGQMLNLPSGHCLAK